MIAGNYKHIPWIRRNIQDLFKTVVIRNGFFDITIETNYYAVFFETCCFLKLYDICSKVYTFLSSRKNIDGLYMFKDGTIRVDITIHVLNGIRQLCS